MFFTCNRIEADEASVLSVVVKLFGSTSHSLCIVFVRDMLKYTASVRDWMSTDPKNIIAIHCKGGKGDYLLVSSSFRIV